MSNEVSTHALGALQDAIRSGRLKAAVRRRAHGAALDTARRAVGLHGRSVDELEQLARAFEVVQAQVGDDDRETLRRKQASLRRAGRALSAELDTDAIERSATVLAEVEQVTRDVRDLLRRLWQQRVKDAFGDFARLAQVARDLLVTDGLGAEMDAAARDGLAFGARFPPDAAVAAAFEAAVARRDAALERLAAAGSGLGVFLLAVARGEATLADVDADVLAWLDREGTRSRFRIRL